MYEKIKNDILGKKYSISIALVTARKSQEINKRYRKKDRPTNVLSFAFSKDEGEILLCPAVIKKEVKDRQKNLGRTYLGWLGFLVIHGMLHLKGMEHSSRMEKAEAKYDQKYFSGHRYRLSDHPSRGGRVLKRRKKS